MAMEQILSIPQPAKQCPKQFPYSGHPWSGVGVNSSYPPCWGTARPRLLGEGARGWLGSRGGGCPCSRPYRGADALGTVGIGKGAAGLFESGAGWADVGDHHRVAVAPKRVLATGSMAKRDQGRGSLCPHPSLDHAGGSWDPWPHLEQAGQLAVTVVDVLGARPVAQGLDAVAQGQQ